MKNMTNDLSNQNINADIILKEPITPLAFWFPITAITILSGLGAFLLIQQDYVYGLSLIFIAGLIWTQLK